MKIYVLVTSDGVISGIYSNQSNLINDLTTSLANLSIDKVEI